MIDGSLLNDQFIKNLPRRLDQRIPIVARVIEPNQPIHFFVQITITRCELVLECAQDEEIHLVGAVRVRRMTLWLDISRIVMQDVEHEM